MPASAHRSAASERTRLLAATPPDDHQGLDLLLVTGAQRLGDHRVGHALLERRGDVRGADAGVAGRGHVAGHRALEAGEGEAQRRVALPHERAREPDGARVALARGPVDRGTAGVRQPEQPGHLVEGLARGVVEGVGEVHDRRAHQVAHREQAGVAAAHDERDAAVGQRAVHEGVGRGVAGQVVHAVERDVRARARRPWRRRRRRAARSPGPGPAVTATAPTSCQASPASSIAACIVGTIACTCARAAISGTTPPNRTCSSMLEASASPSSTPSRTRPTPVSSHEVSMPRTTVTGVILPTATLGP